VSGRRRHLRSHGDSAEGTIRVCRDVTIERDNSDSGVAVLSDVGVPAGEKLTLFLVSAAGQLELRVEVLATQPHIVNGTLRHRLRLGILTAAPVIESGPCEPHV
jgi:hypothetical protein